MRPRVETKVKSKAGNAKKGGGKEKRVCTRNRIMEGRLRSRSKSAFRVVARDGYPGYGFSGFGVGDGDREGDRDLEGEEGTGSEYRGLHPS